MVTVMILGIFSKKAMHWVGVQIWAPVLVGCVGGSVKSKGNENIDLSRPCIYVANHSSHFDIPVLFITFQIFLFFIAKKELKKIPLFGWANTMAGTIWIDRKDRSKAKESMLKAGENIKTGKNVISFPEGTRSKDGNIGIFKRGTFQLAQNCDVDIVPIYIKGTRPLNPPGSWKFRPSKVLVVIGERLSVKDFKDKTPEEFANYTQSMVIKMSEENC
jgi:1-acyl-sn-glycerol-3-phosphate acyltransferase